MNVKKLVLFVVLADFVAFTVWVLATGGSLTEVVAAFSVNPWILQVSLDLVLALSLVSIWVWSDARKRGKNPVPWIVATLFTGSIAPLTYLLFRSGPAEQRS
jgi:membrane protein implicated in regulation of membrane protease activity